MDAAAIEKVEKRFPPNRWSIQEFELVSILGHGNLGTVWFAIEKKMKYPVAIKEINRSTMEDAFMERHIFNELYLHSMLKHDNVIRFLTYFADAECLYFVLEYATFGSLYSVLQDMPRKRLDESTAALYCKQMADALLYVHSEEFLHGDLKPENILVDAQRNVKLSDFGLSWHYATSYDERGFCGTLEYLCPELIASEYYDFTIDNWSLGVLVYEMLCGKSPFGNCRRSLTKKKILNLDYVFPRNISKDAQNLIKKLLVRRADRLSLDKVLRHKWIERCSPKDPPKPQE